MKWNTSSLKTNELVESSGNEQVIYQERKTHSSISMVGDILYRRTFEKWEDFIICWGKPEQHPKKPPRSGFRRCEIVLLGFQVTKAGEDSVQLAMTSAFHELGNVPGLVIQDELKKIALRISKIIQRVGELRRINARTYQPTVQKIESREAVKPDLASGFPFKCSECGNGSEGRFCATCGGKCREQNVGGGPTCPKCGTSDTGARFCAACGHKLK